MSFKLYMLQRLSALIMAPLVILHLVVILWAVQGGLSADEIIGRFQSSFFWPLLYGIFVISASIHAPIGLRNIAREWWPRGDRLIDLATFLLFGILIVLGGRMLVALGSS